MKPLATLLTVFFIAGAGCSSTPGQVDQADARAIKAQLHQAMHQSAKDWTNDDLDGFMRAFHNSPDTRFAIPTGITMGWQAIKDRYKRSIDKSSLWFTDIDVTVITHDTVLVFARFHNEMKADKSYSTGLTTLLMKKIDGSWVIIHDHSSGLPKDTPRKGG